MRTKPLVAILGLAGAGLVLAGIQETPYLPVGETAPIIESKANDGKSYSTSNLAKEKPLFVVFWKERCPHNPRASALFNSLNKAYEGKAQLVGVVNATESGAASWVKQFEVNYPMLTDADKAAIKAYRLRYSITTVQIGTDGKISKVFEGYGKEQMASLNEAMASAAGTKPAEVDLTGAPGRLTWG